MRCSFSWNKHDVALRREFGLRAHAAHDFIAVRRPVLRVEVRVVAGRVVAEDADVARAEHAAQLDRSLELVEVRLERLIDRDLADRRADCGETEALAVEQLLEFLDLLVGQREDVRLVNRAKLDESDAAGFQHRDLLARIGGNLVGKGGSG